MPKPERSLSIPRPSSRPREIDAEEDELFTMSNLRSNLTGLPASMVVWISPRADSPHDARIKVSKGPRYRKDSVVTVGLRPRAEIKHGTWPFSAKDFERLEAWIALNLETLIDFWEERIEYDDEVRVKLKKLP